MAGNFSIAVELKSRRCALGLNLNEVGERCGLDELALRGWENGAGTPPPDALERWAAALGLRVALLPVDAAVPRGIDVDWKLRRITVDGTAVRLTPMEWKVLDRLAWSPGRLVTHQQLFKHLYGEERDCRAQATAVRVLINKLRRLLPIRIEARWGQGYILDGIGPSRSDARADASEGSDDPGNNGGSGRVNGSKPVSMTSPLASAIAVAPSEPARNGSTGGHKPPLGKVCAARPAVSPPANGASGRAEELSVIERFLAERGVTRCPDPRSLAQSSHSELIWDKAKRKWVRPAPLEMPMSASQ